MNPDLLKGKLREHAMTQAEIAPKIGLSLSRFNAKLNETGGAEFSLSEVCALKSILNLDMVQAAQIFFTSP